MAGNELGTALSPYLRQHADNPVAWRQWGPDALAEARAGDRPLLVSIGYAACHWCHVMAHESFEDDETAALMNELFVNVKVDREERPDVDAVYMDAVTAMTGHGGWPLTVFCLPDGRPFFGGTYFPPAERHGMPAFRTVLRAVSEAYAERRDEAARHAETVLAAIARQQEPAPGAPTRQLLDQAVTRLVAFHDDRLGGFGGAPKFPPAMPLTFLLRRHVGGDDRALAPVRITLDAMAAGGMYDQLGGGFHRYSVDARWAVPHFEKMLYDNALLARTYLRAHLVTGERRDRRVCEETLDFVLRDLRDPAGGFHAALDADTPEGEGAFYVFTPDDVRQALRRSVEDAGGPGGAADLAMAHLGVTTEGNFEESGATVLHLAMPAERLAAISGTEVDQMEDALAQIRRRLKAWRDRHRTAPDVVDTVIVAWNGLMISALADAGFHLRRADYVDAAREAADFLLEHLRRPDGRLLHCWRDGRAADVLGFLDDHGALAEALLSLYEVTGDARYVGVARELVDTVLERFAAPDGGFFTTGDDHEELVRRPSDRIDNAVPSGTSLVAEAALRLAALTGEDRYRSAAESALSTSAGWYANQPTAFGYALCAVDRLLAPSAELAIVGEPADALLDVARGAWRPNLAVAWGGGAEVVPLLADRPLVQGRPAAYVCRNFACRAPTAEPQELAAQLADY
jgi:hypothetical protein